MAEKKKFKDFVRRGYYICWVEYTETGPGSDVFDSRIIWKFNLYIFINLPLVLLFIALVALRFRVSMEVFNNFWYCALR